MSPARFADDDVIDGLLVLPDNPWRPASPIAYARRQLALYERGGAHYDDPLRSMAECRRALAHPNAPTDVRAAWRDFYREAHQRLLAIRPRLP